MNVWDKVRRALRVHGPKHAMRRAAGKLLYWTLEDRMEERLATTRMRLAEAPSSTGLSLSAGVQSFLTFHRLQRLASERPSRALVSVVMVAGRRPHGLPRAIRSVLKQTHEQWELVVGLDPARPEPESLLVGFRDNPRVRFLTVEGAGESSRLNRCIAEARGEWIAYLDGDHAWEPFFLSTLLAALEEAPTLRLAHCGWFVHGAAEDGDGIRLSTFDRQALLRSQTIDLCALIHRRALVEERGALDEALPCLHRWELLVRYTAGEAPLSVAIPLCHDFSPASRPDLTASDPLHERCRYEVLQQAIYTHRADTHLVTWPDYRATNPYQSALYSEFERHGISVDSIGLGALNAALRGDNVQGPVVFHLHWTAPILTNTDDPEEARSLRDAFLSDLDEFLSLGGFLIWTLHNRLPHDVRHPEIEIELRAALAQRAHRILVHSAAAQTEVSALVPLPSERVQVLPHGSYIGLYPDQVGRDEARLALGVPEAAVCFLHIGQLRPYKGVTELIKAYGELSVRPGQAHLWIAGQPKPPTRPEVLERQTAGMQGVSLHQGFIPDDELQLYLNAADFVVLPYRSVLTSGAALLALSFGCPVIAPRMGALAELIEDGRQGLLYPPGEPGALRDALQRALDLGSSARQRQATSSRQLAERLDWAVISGDLASEITELVWSDQDAAHDQDTPISREVDIESESVVCDVRPGDSADARRVAVVILNYRGLADTCLAARTVLESTYRDFRLYLVDNHSLDRSRDVLQRRFPEQTVVSAPRNLGYAGGNNIGIQLAREQGAKLIWLLNPDTRVPPSLLGELVAAADAHDETAIFGSKIYLGHSTDRLWFAGGVVRWERGLETYHLNQGEPDPGGPSTPYRVDYVTGASLFFRSQVVESVGLLPEEFFLYFEETDWCLRAAAAGFGIAVHPSTFLFHEKRSEEGGLPQPYYLYYYIRNRLLLCHRHRPEKLEATRRLQREFIESWVDRVRERRPSYLPVVKRLVAAAIEDGLANQSGRRDLSPLIQGA